MVAWLLMALIAFVLYSIMAERGGAATIGGAVTMGATTGATTTGAATMENYENGRCGRLDGQFPDMPEYLPTGQLLDVPPPSSIGSFDKDMFNLGDALMWAEANPVGAGSLRGKNFLDSGYMSSQIDTVGTDRKTINIQLRADPTVPSYNHSVFRPILFAPTDLQQRILAAGSNTC